MAGAPQSGDGESELEKRMKEVGLDAEKWALILKEKLGITSPQALESVTKKDLKLVEKECKFPWETKALNKLLNVKSSRERGMQFLKKLLDKKAKGDENAAAVTDSFGSSENLTKDKKPEDMSSADDKSCNSSSMISQMDEDQSMASYQLIPRDSVTDQEVLEKASGGGALKGVYDVEDECCETTEALLKVGSSVTLNQPTDAQGFQEIQVQSREEENQMRRFVRKRGFSQVLSADASCCLTVGVGFGVRGRWTDREENETPRSEEATYACKMQYTYAPQASFQFSDEQLILSDPALSALRQIENVRSRNKTEQCRQFFAKYGSHANKGRIHFGGILCRKASVEDFEASQADQVTQFNAQELKANFGLGILEPFDRISGQIDTAFKSPIEEISKGQAKQSERAQIITWSNLGGPSEANTLEQWKQGTADSKQTWAIINRAYQLVPVWEIILMNHKDDFQNAIELAQCLEKAFCQLSGREVSGISAENELQLILKEIPTWEVSQAEECLEKICNLKEIESFAEVFLKNEDFQKFLESIMSSKPNSKIMFFISFLLDNRSSKGIPNQKKIENWLAENQTVASDEKEVKTASGFLEVLQKIAEWKAEYFHSTPICQLFLKNQTSSLVCSSLKPLLQKSDTSVEEQLLLMSLIEKARFDKNNCTFSPPLEPAFVAGLYLELKEMLDDLHHQAEKGKVNEQAYIFCTVLNLHKRLQPSEMNKQVQKMKRVLGSAICPEMKELLDFEAEPTVGFPELAEKLGNIIEGKETSHNDIVIVNEVVYKHTNVSAVLLPVSLLATHTHTAALFGWCDVSCLVLSLPPLPLVPIGYEGMSWSGGC